MAFSVSADPTVAFVDAIKTRLESDATLDALITGVYGHVSEAARTNYPYVVLGRRRVPTDDIDQGVMGVNCVVVELQIDVWSDAEGPFTVTNICSRLYALLERYALSVTGFDVVSGSLSRHFQDVFNEPDEDNPEQKLYHGVQRWRCELHQQ
jgi:hypothetical protein